MSEITSVFFTRKLIMIKKIFVVLTALILVGFSMSALAEKPAKSTIFHCGCVLEFEPFATARLAWTEMDVSHKSGGHLSHSNPETCGFTNEWELSDSITLLRMADCESDSSLANHGLLSCGGDPTDGTDCDLGQP
jgi:hypothetical protein